MLACNRSRISSTKSACACGTADGSKAPGQHRSTISCFRQGKFWRSSRRQRPGSQSSKTTIGVSSFCRLPRRSIQSFASISSERCGSRARRPFSPRPPRLFPNQPFQTSLRPSKSRSQRAPSCSRWSGRNSMKLRTGRTGCSFSPTSKPFIRTSESTPSRPRLWTKSVAR